jgi:hypothetical protein
MRDETPMSREAAQRLAKRVLAFSTADEARVNIRSGWSGNTRFAGNELITTPAARIRHDGQRHQRAFGTRQGVRRERNVLDRRGG